MSQSIKEISTRLLQPIFSKKDPNYIRLILYWEQIVGREWSNFLDIGPIRHLNGSRGAYTQLTLDCYGKTPFECQFQTPFLIEKINGYSGFLYVHDIVYVLKSNHPKQ